MDEARDSPRFRRMDEENADQGGTEGEQNEGGMNEDREQELRDRDAETLGEVLDQLWIAEDGADGDKVSLEEMREVIGHRAFGPFLLVVGILALTPVGAIPGVPTTLAVIVVLMGAQMLLGLKGIWLPGFVLHRSLSRDKLERSLGWIRPAARWLDRVLHPRLRVLTDRVALHVMAVVCVLMGLMIPPLEFVPFAVTVPSLALTLFGLSLITNDGLLALLAFALSGVGFYLVAANVFL